MSEWGIPNTSTFGGGGGCFISILSLLGGLFLVALLTNIVSISVSENTTDTVTDTITVKDTTSLEECVWYKDDLL